MPDQTTILSMPYIMPSQAQKHVTHNEALRLLDVVVQLAVFNRNRTAPPALPSIGDRHIVAAGPSGAWAGRAGDVAVFADEGWEFYTPLPGWRAHILAESSTAVFDGSDWVIPGSGPLNPSQLGVNTAANTTNRLAVAADATLLTHDGGGHQLKVNKSATSQTASLLFQSGFSGRAEMGLAGNNDFSVKVSANGTAFQTALVADAATAVVTLPNGVQAGYGTVALPGMAFAGDADTGLFRAGANQIGFACGSLQSALVNASEFQIDVPVTGVAVQSGPNDATAGRLLKVGAFGLGGEAPFISGAAALDAIVTNRRVKVAVGDVASVNGPAGAATGVVDTLAYGPANAFQIYCEVAGARRKFQRVLTTTWGDWAQVIDQRSIVGTVAQVSGQPTGAVIEQGANANGIYTRWADGTQICSQFFSLSLTIANALLGGYRSPGISWTYPAAFVATPVVSPTSLGQTALGAIVHAANSSAATALVTSVTSQVAAQRDVSMLAVGRWF